MKKLKEVIEVENSGLMSLLGKDVLICTAGYFYKGTLTGVNDTCVELTNPSIVYETGPWSDKVYKNEQKLHTDIWFVSTGLIESFGISK